jgi:hypothetical protein
VNQPLKDAGASKAMQQAYSLVAMVMTGLVDHDMALVLEQQAQADQNDGGDSMPYLDAIANAAIEAADLPRLDMQALPGEEPLPPCHQSQHYSRPWHSRR